MLLQGTTFRYFIILTTIMPLTHYPVRGHSAEGPPACACRLSYLKFDLV